MKKYSVLKIINDYQLLLFNGYKKIHNVNRPNSVICKSNT